MTSDKVFIIRKAQEGDKTAIRLIYEDHYQYVLDYCHRYLMNFAEAKDVTQDIFIRVFDKIGTYREEGEFGAWLNLVCRNHIISYIRKEKKIIYESINEFSDYEKNQSEDIDENTFESYRKNLSVNEVYDLIGKLDDRSRIIFNLFAIESLSHRDIAAQLGISEGTSKSQLSRARIKLRELLMWEFEKQTQVNKTQSLFAIAMIAILIIIKGATI